jgi:hypothetical protein
MWMGGVPPLGYGVRDHKLVMIDSEADTVRLIFRRYAELGLSPIVTAGASTRAKKAINSMPYEPIPYASEQGIF